MANQITLKDSKLSIGDIVRIHMKVKEGNKEKVQAIEGRIIAFKGRFPNGTFTIRKIGADNIGVEKIFPVESPLIERVEVKKSIPAKRAKLYYLRNK